MEARVEAHIMQVEGKLKEQKLRIDELEEEQDKFDAAEEKQAEEKLALKAAGSLKNLLKPKPATVAVDAPKASPVADASANEWKPETINLMMVVVYYVSNAHKGYRLDAAAWMMVTAFVACADICLLFSLSTTNNWVACASQDDCPLGTVCAHLPHPDGNMAPFRMPFCTDCHYLSDSNIFPNAHSTPWRHELIAEPGTNGTALCEEQLRDPHNLKYIYDSYYDGNQNTLARASAAAGYLPSHESCLYSLQARSMMNSLDICILFIAFTLLSLASSKDAGEQDEARFLRRLTCPWRVPSLEEPSTIAMLGANCFMYVADVAFSRAVPALMPCAMLMLLITQGSSSSDILLNGLSIGFVLELDNAIPDCFLKVEAREEIERHFSAVVAKRASSDMSRVMHVHERHARLVCLMAGFLYGFTRVTTVNHGISCETMLYFMYYHVSLLFAVWLPFAMQEAIHAWNWWRSCVSVLVAGTDKGSAVRAAKPPPKRDETASPKSRRASQADFDGILAEFNEAKRAASEQDDPPEPFAQALFNTVSRFTEMLLCAVMLNFAFWFMTTIMQWESPPHQAWNYAYGFVKDVFGLCAGSGYMDEWGYSCIPIWSPSTW